MVHCMIDQTSIPPESDSGTVSSESSGSPPSGVAPVAGTAVEGAAHKEVGGRVGPEPTRYGDWEKNGRCIDF